MVGASGLDPVAVKQRAAVERGRKERELHEAQRASAVQRGAAASTDRQTDRVELDAELAGALTAGSPTKPIRQQIAEVDRAEAQRRQTEAEQEAIAADAVEAEAAALADQAALRIVEMVADPSLSPDQALAAVRSGGLALAEAQAYLTRALHDLAHAEAEAAEIESRLRTAGLARSDILARRQTGTEKPDDGEVVSLLDLDSEGLRSLLVEAQAVVGQRRGSVAECRALVARAASELQLAEDRATLAALTARADGLAAQLSDTLSRLEAARERCGQRPSWSPGMQLYRQIRKAASYAGLL